MPVTTPIYGNRRKNVATKHVKRIRKGTDAFDDMDVAPAAAVEEEAANEETAVCAEDAAVEGSSPTAPPAPPAIVLPEQRLGGWARVRRCIFSGVEADVAAALRAINYWQQCVAVRGMGLHLRRLPGYIQATRALAEAQQLDRRCVAAAVAGGDSTLEAALPMAYATAILRCVFELTEAAGQRDGNNNNNGKFAATYRQRAQMIAMPEELVEARNQIAHGRMPTLAQLRFATALGLQYLCMDVWEHKHAALRDAKARDAKLRPKSAAEVAAAVVQKKVVEKRQAAKQEAKAAANAPLIMDLEALKRSLNL